MTQERSTPKNVIRREREARGWTQEYLAELLGVQGPTPGTWERGERNPSLKHRAALENIFNLNPGALRVDMDENENEYEEEFNNEPPSRTSMRSTSGSLERNVPLGKKNELPSTYIVQNRSNQEEIIRLQIQDQMMTTSMGGVLPEQSDSTSLKRVLDVGCGTGGWLIDVASQLPQASLLAGVDVSGTMLDYARSQAQAAGVADRVEFRMMDALRMIEFPKSSFDLVNLRLGMSYLRTWDWPNLLQEFQRVTRSDGIIRITEADMPVSSSPALNKLVEFFFTALVHSGHFFIAEQNGLTSRLPALLRQMGILNIQEVRYTNEYRVGTPEGRQAYDDTKHAYLTWRPFIEKWTPRSDNYMEIYQQALVEMQQPDFVTTWTIVTVWGKTAQKK